MIREGQRLFSSRKMFGILQRHALQQVPVKRLCHSHGIDSSAFFKWQRRFFEKALPSIQAQGRGPTISVVIPALNEERNLPHVLPRIPEWIHEVILVDGHSTDRTVEVARELRPEIRIVAQRGRGKGAALCDGFAAATGEIIVMLDADGSMDPAEIPVFVGALLAGADFAKGSRFLGDGGTADMPLHRKLGNWGLVGVVRCLFGGRYTDLCYGYNAFWTRVLPELDPDRVGFEIETMLNTRALRAGLRIVEVPSFEAKRIYGEGNLKAIPDGLRILATIMRERFGGDRESTGEVLGTRPLWDLGHLTDEIPAHGRGRTSAEAV